MDDVVREFLVESNEGLDRLDRSLVALEQTPSDQARLAEIFRCIHTIKGTSGFLGFGRLESVTHVGESLLSDLRDGTKVLTPEITSALLRLGDAVRAMLAAIESTGADGQEDFTSLVDLLTRLQAGERAIQAVPEPPAAGTPEGAARSRKRRRSDRLAAPSPPGPTLDPEGITAHPSSTAMASNVEAAGEVRGPSASDSNIRVDVGLLDKLMNLVGELVLARNQILQCASGARDPAFIATTQRLSLITSDLQEGVMKTRMQPIGNVWAKFPRVVRDLSLACGKQVRIEMEGQDTELDKTIIEAIKDPLTHIVRNSVDHGLESPAERLSRGKPAEGRLLLRAYHEGGQVNIEIADDGQGINAERVMTKAIQQGILTVEQAGRLNERELANLVFAPGFSTAAQVSNISGRGVGLDVVKTNIEKIGGAVDIVSVPGRGTTLKMKIPLTLAIIPALMVTTEGDRFAIPQVSLLELVRLESDVPGQGIEMVHGSPVYRLREQLLPLVSLSQALGYRPGFHRQAGPTGSASNIVVLQADQQIFGLVVDEISDTEEIVVKPLGRQLKTINAFAGATIMGDGRVALILDVVGLAHRAAVVSETGGRWATDGVRADRTGAAERERLLLFRLGDDRRLAIPLSMVTRLEEFPVGAVERAGRHELVQYRGRLLPLVRLADLMDTPAAAEARETLTVVVYTHEGLDVGLVVDSIVDIVEETLTVHRRKNRGPVFGTAVVHQKATDLLDIRAVLEGTDALLFDHPEAEPAGAGVLA